MRSRDNFGRLQLRIHGSRIPALLRLRVRVKLPGNSGSDLGSADKISTDSSDSVSGSGSDISTQVSDVSTGLQDLTQLRLRLRVKLSGSFGSDSGSGKMYWLQRLWLQLRRRCLNSNNCKTEPAIRILSNISNAKIWTLIHQVDFSPYLHIPKIHPQSHRWLSVMKIGPVFSDITGGGGRAMHPPY